MKTNLQKIHDELEEELADIEKHEEDYGINQMAIDEIKTKTMTKIEEMHENKEISDFVYDKYVEKINEKNAQIMYEKGYDMYEYRGNVYYSKIPKAKKAYDNLLDELNKRQVKYEVSKSWNAGELPSIYVEDDDGNQFRISNHFNNKNQQFKAYSYRENKIYSSKDYINYKETILKDLDEFLNK